MSGIIIAGTHTGVGKTTICSGVMGNIPNVAPFKSGPDFIDPGFHKFVTNKPSYNLDLFMSGEENVKALFSSKSANKIGVIEGVMGLYDGLSHEFDNYSTAHLSRVLNLPVILIVDGEGCATSIAAKVLGFCQLDPRVNIAGVILNNVNTAGLYHYLRDAIEQYTNVSCFGYFATNPQLKISSRHLGLQQAEELANLSKTLKLIKQAVSETVDIDGIIKLANSAPEMTVANQRVKVPDFSGRKIAIARDQAFSFYYQSNLDLLAETGAEITYFSPLADEVVPVDADFIYLGGGYPENFAEILSSNNQTKASILQHHQLGKGIYAECGGYIYLSNSLTLTDGKTVPMCGIFASNFTMQKTLDVKHFGYVDISLKNKKIGRAHEFHYSSVSNQKTPKFTISKGSRTWKGIEQVGSAIAGYPHIQFIGNMELFSEFLSF